jgi:RNA polymerase sigma-70 factor (ECF subfamily)
VPEAADLPERLGGVLAVLFLVFNEGYLATGDGDPVRAELTGEAIRLSRVLRQLLPAEPELAGLLGLLVLTEARREARVRNWAAGPARRAGSRRLGPRADRRGARPGPRVPRDQPTGRYQILAAINAVHTDAPPLRGRGAAFRPLARVTGRAGGTGGCEALVGSFVGAVVGRGPVSR